MNDMNDLEDILPGGLADEMSPLDFDPEQLRMGIEHELEHTNDPQIAREVAMDHLAEDPEYYTKIQQIEETLRHIISHYIEEQWDRHLDRVIDPGEDLPFDQDPESADPRDSKNPFRANNKLSKVKASVPGKGQRAGVGLGSGPMSGRQPGGQRQAATSVHESSDPMRTPSQFEITANDLALALGSDLSGYNLGVYPGTDFKIRQIKPDAKLIVSYNGKGSASVSDMEGGWIADRFGPGLGAREYKSILQYLG